MKTGIVLHDLGASQAAFMAISYANTLFANRIQEDITLFYCTNVPVITKPIVASMNVDKCHQFDGLLVATDLYTASIITKCNAKKVLYLWDLEWLRGKGSYIANVNLLVNSGFTVYCRSPYHAVAIENYCGVKPAVVSNFNLKEIIERAENEVNDKRA